MVKTKRSAATRTLNTAKRQKTNTDDSTPYSSPTKSNDGAAAEETADDLQEDSAEDQADLNYDEYDLSEECDMVVRCKTCDTVFLSLEKFISHKKSQCKGRKSDVKPSVFDEGADNESVAQLMAQIPVSSADEVDEDKGRGDANEDGGRGDVMKSDNVEETVEEILPTSLIKPVTKVYSSRRSRNLAVPRPDLVPPATPLAPDTKDLSASTSCTESSALVIANASDALCAALATSNTESIDINDRIKAPTLPDEVERISDLSSHEQPRNTVKIANAIKSKSVTKTVKVQEAEVEYNIDDLVSVSVNQEEDNDPDLPVDVKVVEAPATPRYRFAHPQNSAKTEAAPTKPLTPYRLVEVVENTTKVMAQPSLALTFEQLKEVKILNLLTPLPAPPLDIQSLMDDGSILGTIQTVLASSKDDRPLKLILRRIVKPADPKEDELVPEEENKIICSDTVEEKKEAENMECEGGKDGGQAEDMEVVGEQQREDSPDKQPEVLTTDNQQGVAQDVSHTTDKEQENSQTSDSQEKGSDADFDIWRTDEEDDGKIDMVEADGEIAVTHTNTASDIITFEELGEKAEEASEVKSDIEGNEEDDDYEAMEFEHDPDLYDYLRDDEYYTLGPKQRGRMACVDIKSRTDCDWQMRRCFRCNTLYSCIKTLTNHMSYQHADKKVFYPCIYCRNIYSQQKNLSRHLNKTHDKSLEFVAKLRAFVRNQAFVRQLKTLDYNSEKLTEENDPFLRNMRRRVPPARETRYCSVPDKEMLAKFGRKIRMIGRPPGRPSKNRSKSLLMTCTLCKMMISTAREMLRHLKDAHSFSQKTIAKLRPKLFSKVQEVAVQERQKAVEREKELLAAKIVPLEAGSGLGPSELRNNNVLIKGLNIDRYGRLILNKPEASLSVTRLPHMHATNKPTPVPVNIAHHRSVISSSPMLRPSVPDIAPAAPAAIVTAAPPYVFAKEKTNPMCLTQCQSCLKIFVNRDALDKHTPSCTPAKAQHYASNSQVFEISVPQSTPAPPAVQQLIVEQGAIRPAMPPMVVEQTVTSHPHEQLIVEQTEYTNLETEGEIVEENDVYFKVIKTPSAYGGTSGLDTLAMISTNEANKAGSPQTTNISTTHTSLSTTHVTEVQAESDSTLGSDLQTVTITEDQLEQLKASGGNIIYLVKTPSGGVERIDTPQGMEVVEISQIADGHSMHF